MVGEQFSVDMETNVMVFSEINKVYVRKKRKICLHQFLRLSNNRDLRAEDEEQDTRLILHQCYKAVFKETAEYH